ncbi:MAG: XdhC family protein [Anaerolineae bacterium]|nr:XdhC family protein [Anaerolineae bacterium]
MRDIVSDLRRWREEGREDIAVATILKTEGSSLRPAGTRMAITSDGGVVGSVSSGCVDGDVISEMEAVLTGSVAIRRPNYGISDEEAWSVGLSCGGAIDVLVERWTELYDVLLDEVEAQRPVGFASRTDRPQHLIHLADGETVGTLGNSDLDGQVLMDIAAAWPGPYAKVHTYTQGKVLIEVIPPPPVLLIFGATDIGIALAEIGRVVGYRVIVSDARRTFLTEERFPGFELHFGWPRDVFRPEDLGPSYAVVVLFHDPKFDIPALTLALKSKAYYIGFLGSRKTQADRREELLQAGFKESDLDRIRGPVGLDIGGKEPSMIALSIMAEVAAVRHRRSGGALSAVKR